MQYKTLESCDICGSLSLPRTVRLNRFPQCGYCSHVIVVFCVRKPETQPAVAVVGARLHLCFKCRYRIL
jgi:hypothetical protein